jgi:hypothetical protein
MRVEVEVNQLAHMRRHAARQRGHVVASLQHRDDSPLTQLRSNLQDTQPPRHVQYESLEPR